MESRAGEVKLASSARERIKAAARPSPLGPLHVRRLHRPRRRARIHARLDHAPRCGDDRDRLDRPGGGVRRRLPVAVLGRAARLAGIEGGGRLRQPAAVRRAVGLDRPHHRHFGDRVARARRRRPAARAPPRRLRPGDHRRRGDRVVDHHVAAARPRARSAAARERRAGRGREPLPRHRHPRQYRVLARHGAVGRAARGRRRAARDVRDAGRRRRHRLHRSAADLRLRSRRLRRGVGDRAVAPGHARLRPLRRNPCPRSRRPAERAGDPPRSCAGDGDRRAGDPRQSRHAGRCAIRHPRLVGFRRRGGRRRRSGRPRHPTRLRRRVCVDRLGRADPRPELTARG